MKTIITILKAALASMLLIAATPAFSQGVIISENPNDVVNPASILEVRSDDKGLLIPRMTEAQRLALTLSEPAQGLMVFQTDATFGYYYNISTTTTPSWVKIYNGVLDPWRLGGNALAAATANSFLGTTNDFPLNFKVNGQNAGRIDNTLANTFLGFQSGNGNTTAKQNVAIGTEALKSQSFSFNNTPYNSDNVAVGFRALFSNQPIRVSDNENDPVDAGIRNTAVGSQALTSNTTGFNNTAIGFAALSSCTTGFFNTAIGSQALFSNTNGFNNIAIGSQALFANTNGFNNIAIGSPALASNTGSNNTAIGHEALRSNSTGIQNTAIGSGTLSLNGEGNGNTALGFQALSNSGGAILSTAIGTSATVNGDNLINATAIGAFASVNTSNSLVLGSAANVGIGTSSPVSKLDVVGSGNNSATSALDVKNSSSTSILFVRNDGNVGIGNNSPGAKLDIVGSGNTGTTTALHVKNSSSTSMLSIRNNGNIGIGIAAPVSRLDVVGSGTTSATSALNVKNSSSTSMLFVRNDGNVGIGINAPTSKLQVNGTFATSVVSFGTANNILLDDRAAVWDFSGAVTGARLPSPSTCPGRRYIIVNRKASVLNITNASYGGLDGNPKTSVPANSSIEIISNATGTTWLQIK